MSNEASIKGAIKVSGIPQGACFTSFADLLNALGQFLTVEIPNQSFSNVVISTQQPGAADVGKLWVRRANNGNFVGFYLFQGGAWVQFYPVPQQLFWLYGTPGPYPDSDTPPPGFKLLEASDNLLSLADYNALIATAIPAGSTPPFSVYPAIFVGT